MERIWPPEASEIMGVCTGTLANWRAQKKGPKFFQLGKGGRGRIFYDKQDVMNFLTSNQILTRDQRD